jgi:hypothetical protein
MALLWLEGFDNYGASGMTGTALENAIRLRAPESDIYCTGDSSRLAAGYGIGLGLELGVTNEDLGVTVVLPASTDWVVGFAFKANTLSRSVLIEFSDDPANSSQNYLLLEPSGLLVAYQGSGDVLGYSTVAVKQNEWYYLEYRLNASVTEDEGEVEIRLNGASVLTAPGRSGGTVMTTDPITTITVRGSGDSDTDKRRGMIDDIYIADGASFLGPLKVVTLRPDADTTVEWTPSTGSTNYNLVNETPDLQTTYVSSGTANDSDLYDIGDLPAIIVDIVGVQIEVQAKLSATGSETLSIQCESDSIQSAVAVTVDSTSWAAFSTILETDPATSAAWLTSAIDALQVGVKNGS